MIRPRSFTEQHVALAATPLVLAALVPAAFVYLAAKAAEAGWKAARQASYRHAAQIDREFAKYCTARLHALRGAAPSVWRRALRELAREREARETERDSLSESPCAAARRARARARRDEAWCAWFTAMEQAAGRPSAGLFRVNPIRRGPPVRRLCTASVNDPPAQEAVYAQYEKARGRARVEEKIRLGSMLLDAEASVDSSLRRDEYGTIVGRNPGLRGWIADNCPALLKHYQTLLGYRRLAAEFRDVHDLGDPCPAALLLGEDPSAEAKLPPRTRALLPVARRRARTRLKKSEAATVKAFAEKLKRSWAEPRDQMRRLA